jgi:putative PIN family toxin of toxin-antitoxin system
VRVIVDTNVLVSGFLFPSGPPAKIVNAILRGALVPVMSHATLSELEAVLSRPRLRLYLERTRFSPSVLVAELARVAEIVSPVSIQSSIRDEKDRPFLELAASHPPVDFLITGDKDFEQQRYEGVPVISAALFARTKLE